MKIYEIGTGYTPIPATMGAATEIVVEELTKSMQKQGLDVTIIDIKAKNRIENTLPIIEVNVPSVFTGTDVQLGIMHKLKRIIYSINLALKLKKIIKKEKGKTVLHFHNQYNLFFFLKLTNKKIRNRCLLAYTNHSYIWHGDWNRIKDAINKRYFQEVYCMQKADLVYVLNEHTMDNIVNHIGIDQKKVRLIDNGVNLDIYKPLSYKEKELLKEEMGLKDKIVYLQVGSVCERKNQLGATELLLPLLKENSDSCFIYAGGVISEEYQSDIKSFARQNGIESQILYVGEVSPGEVLNKYYNLADVMVFPSKSEGFSLVIIEAMAAGIPVIINNELQFKLSDKCLKYGTNHEFIEIMRNCIHDEENKKKISIEVRKAVEENYSWDNISLLYLESWNSGGEEL